MWSGSTVEDQVADDKPVRLIDAFIDKLELQKSTIYRAGLVCLCKCMGFLWVISLFLFEFIKLSCTFEGNYPFIYGEFQC